MLMIIFGAGASYDSYFRVLPDTPDPDGLWRAKRPPLANQLFDESVYGQEANANNRCTGIFPRLYGVESIEDKLEEISQERVEQWQIARQLVALRYYIRDVIQNRTNAWRQDCTHNATNHTQLFTMVEGWREVNKETVCIVTFNYDTLIEDAFVSSLGSSFSDLSSYVGATRYKLFKVHGSIDWVRAVGNVNKRDAIESAFELEWLEEYHHTKEGVSTSRPKEFVPAIAIPTVNKIGFECPRYHIEMLKSLLPEVDYALVIGWKSAERYFLDLWNPDPSVRKRIKKLQVVTGTPKGASQVMHNIVNVAGIQSCKMEQWGEGFSKFLINDGEALKRFLFS